MASIVLKTIGFKLCPRIVEGRRFYNYKLSIGKYGVRRGFHQQERSANFSFPAASSPDILPVTSQRLPLRPGFGNQGKPTKLHANYFPVKVARDLWFEYDVSVSPPAGTRVKRHIFQLAEQSPDWKTLGSVAHDHSTKLISAKQLPESLSISVLYDEKNDERHVANGKVYTLTIGHVRDIEPMGLLKYLKGKKQDSDYDTMPVVSAINIILAAHPSRGGTMVGRNRFFFPTVIQPSNLGGGLEAWKGFYSSVRPTRKQLMVNVNGLAPTLSTTAFYRPSNLAESMVAFTNSTFGGKLSSFVRGVRVKTQQFGLRTVKALSFLNAGEPTSSKAGLGGEYLRYPKLPLVDIGRDTLIPAELCEILPEQPFRGKLTDMHAAAMIKVATQPPQVNAASITGAGLDALGYRPEVSQQLTAFGISIENQMAVVPGRVLPPPGIKYSKGEPIPDDRASWTLKDVKFVEGAKLGRWVVLIVKDGCPQDEFASADDPELLATVRGFANSCRVSGMVVDKKDPAILLARLPQRVSTDPTRTAAIEVIRQQLMSLAEKPSFAMVLLSNPDKAIYSGIKHLCDGELAIRTACVQSAMIRKEKGQLRYFANVGLKLNMKMGGVNHTLDEKSMDWLQELPTMLVGIDVTHPSSESAYGAPSITAVVASFESEFSQYPASLELQEPNKEMVTNLDKMMWERLSLFKARNGNILPQRILVYRDGVSESQFKSVLDEELPAMRSAFQKFDTPETQYRPAVTIVVCGKRHHTRFYPVEEVDADKTGNPRPGTVVDRGVTAVYNFDFFLQAHGALQGTARPTHYYVVHDGIGFQADQLQTLTNNVSYMFARATQAVSLVSPAYYAHLACERGRCYLHKFLQGNSNIARSTSKDDIKSVMREAQKAWRNGVGAGVKDTMFYI